MIYGLNIGKSIRFYNARILILNKFDLSKNNKILLNIKLVILNSVENLSFDDNFYWQILKNAYY